MEPSGEDKDDHPVDEARNPTPAGCQARVGVALTDGLYVPVQVGGTHGGADDTPQLEGRRTKVEGEITQGSIAVEVTFTVQTNGSVAMRWAMDTRKALPAPLAAGLLP